VNRHPYTAPATPDAPFMVESRVPVGESRLTTHVFVPFLQAAITMLLIAGCVLVFEWRPVAGAVGAIGLLIWGWRILKADGLLTRLETITGRELDGVPGIGKPGPVGLVNPEQARRDVGRQDSAPASDVPRMLAFVARCHHEGTAEGAQRIKPNTAERDNYVECRDALLRLGLAKWRNEAQHSAGWDLTRDLDTTLAMVEKHVR
jgi:hypothetical protein